MFGEALEVQYICARNIKTRNMKRITRILFIALAMIMAGGASVKLLAHDFEIRLKSGNVLFFNVTDTLKKTVEVTYGGSATQTRDSLPEGELVIPGALRRDSVTYIVSSIGPRAFSGAAKLVKVTIPSSVKKIGDYAFEDCGALKEIVLGPVDQVLGKEVFRNCTSVSSVVFGVKWRRVNLAEFRWSDSLKMVRIPASVADIKGLKNLEHLEHIEIESGNRKFSSYDGMLYSANGKTFYACPCGRKGNIAVKQGTETVLEGAFRACPGVESVDFPSSLSKMSYLEFSDEKNVKRISFASGVPPRTAVKDGTEVFALRIASQDMVISVPDSAYRTYCSAICSSDGEYCNIGGKQAGVCVAATMASSANIVKHSKIK